MPRWTARDIRLFEKLYQGEMMKDEIIERYFPKSRQYGVRRLWQMTKNGLINKKIVTQNGKRVSVYNIGLKGKQELVQVGIAIDEKVEKIEQSRKKQKRYRPRAWNERDLKILMELYRMRSLKLTQILEMCFQGNENYGKKRMGVMKKEWLVISERTRRNGRNEAHYRITEKGVRLLVEKGMLQEQEVVRARDLELSPLQRDVILDANEMRFKCNVPYLDSRAFKRKHELNRGELVVGGFENKGGDYALYILRESPKEQTLSRLIKEIQTARIGIGGYLVFYKGDKKPFEGVRLSTGGKPVHVLPHNDQGIAIMRDLIFGRQLAELVREYGELCEAPENRYRFRHVLKTASEKHFVIETLTGDSVMLERALREYRDKTKVVLFSWQEEEAGIRERIKGANWMEAIFLSKEILKVRL
jgi:DNA-binding PadR family transcriptional regulator